VIRTYLAATVTPIERAVPRTERIAASMEPAVISEIFFSAMALTSASVIWAIEVSGPA